MRLTGLSRIGKGAQTTGVAWLCALGLAGCVAADVGEPQLDVPATWRATQARARPGATEADVAWWRQFRSPELTRLVEAARADNLDLAAAAARVRQAEAQTRLASVTLFPIADGGFSAGRSRSNGNASGRGTVGSGRNSFDLSVDGSLELDVWGRIRAGREAAAQTALATRFDRAALELSTSTGVANTYFTLLAAQDRLRIARENVASATRVLGVIEQRITAGTATSLELAEQQSIVAQQRATIPPLQQQIEQSAATLAVFLGMPAQRLSVAGGSMSRLTVPRPLPGIPSEVLTRRQDVAIAEAQLAAARQDVAAARAQYFPRIVLTGQGGLATAALSSLFEPASTFYSVAAGLTQPILDGDRIAAQVDQARAAQDESLANYRQAVINAFGDVERALSAVRQLARQEVLQREAVRRTREAFELSEGRLREGTIDLVTVLQTQQTLFQAQQTLLQVQLARLQAVVQLYQALGGGWEKPVAPQT